MMNAAVRLEVEIEQVPRFYFLFSGEVDRRTGLDPGRGTVGAWMRGCWMLDAWMDAQDADLRSRRCARPQASFVFG